MVLSYHFFSASLTAPVALLCRYEPGQLFAEIRHCSPGIVGIAVSFAVNSSECAMRFDALAERVYEMRPSICNVE